ncbi:four helix bundle protein [Mucilaginibacter sp. HMF5004]|uniref:four helix bundle protein n=1 Tax=Mucilaginibacter rivuli TaxID=2857527 RepID=UPI001C5CDD6E|nr:four helix bundle protein [Mucilaginibacter rivuli]MBW4888619.1 four helix bundle protein [Mucilaginibacter rivuli]
MHNFRQLNIWKDAMKLAKSVYRLTATFPANERYGLTSQINRSVVSVASNIAEGSSRSSDKEFMHFLSISIGSLFELETQIILANDFEFIVKEDTEVLIAEIIILQKMITNFRKTLNKA